MKKIFLFLLLFLILFSLNIYSTPIISKITIKSNHYVSLLQIQNLMKLKKGATYKPNLLLQDINNILNFYKEKGFFLTSIKIKSINTNFNSVSLTLVIHEGPSYKIKKVNFIGNKNFSNKLLLKISKFKTNMIFSKTSVETIINNLLKFYIKHKYTMIEIKIKNIEIDKITNSLIITFQIDEGLKLYIKDIIFTGNFRTKKYILKKEIRIKKGEIYSPIKFEESKKWLNNLNYLTVENAKVIKLTNSDEIILQYKINEKKLNSISGLIAFSPSDEGIYNNYFLKLNFKLYDIAGTGRAINFNSNLIKEKICKNNNSSLYYNNNKSDLSLWFKEPYLFKTFMWLEITLNYTYEKIPPWIIDNSLNLPTSITVNKYNPILTIGTPITIWFNCYFNIKINSTIYTPKLLDASYYNSVGYSLSVLTEFKTIKNIFYKSSNGIWYKISLETEYLKIFKQPLVTSLIFKLQGDLKNYLKINKRNTLLLNPIFAILTSDIPTNNLKNKFYYIGGANTLRGYKEKQFKCQNYLIFRNEYIYQINNTTTSFLFLDYAIFKNIKVQTKYGYGLGIKKLTHLGLLSLSYGLGEHMNFNEGKIHLSLNYYF